VARGRGGRDAWIWLSLVGRARLALLAAGLLALASVHLSSRTLAGLDLTLGELYEEYPAIVFAALLALGLGLLLAVLPLSIAARPPSRWRSRSPPPAAGSRAF